MTLDAATRRNLELTETLRRGAVQGSLLGVLDVTVTTMGGRLLRRWLTQPLFDLERLNARWGIDLLAANREVMRELEQQGLARLERGRLVPTLAGLAVADSLPPRFEIPAAS